MHKQFISITLLVTIITMLLLTSCSAPVVAPTPTPTPTVTIEPTPVVTATPIPTATPRTEPYTIEECEAKLEAITGTDVTHQKDHDLKGRYGFKDDSYTYLIDRNSGKLAILVNHSNTTSSNPVDIEEAKQIAIDAVKKYDPSLFKLEVKCDTQECGSEYSITLLQVSQKFGRNTGNRADARVTANGDIGSILIHNNEDPTIADQDYAISKEEALEIAYDICIEGIKKQMVNSPDATAELEDRQKHTVEINFSIHKCEPKWSISIIVPSNIGYTLGYAIIINANTGEIIHVGGYL